MKLLGICSSIIIFYAMGQPEAKAASFYPAKAPQKQLQQLEPQPLASFVHNQDFLKATIDFGVVFVGSQILVFATLLVVHIGLARDYYFRSGLSPPRFT